MVYDPDVPHPLIVNYHGMGMGPRSEQAWTGLTPGEASSSDPPPATPGASWSGF